MYQLKKQSKKSKARLGTLKLSHGNVSTPFFMPIATRGAVKNISVDELEKMGSEIILSNTYHLYLKPGEALIKKNGGLNKYMGWDKPILTDSGGYQVFSLAGNKASKDKLVKIYDDGVKFRSHLDGSSHYFTPEKSIQIQQDLGIDIMMAFDVCPPLPGTPEEVLKAVELTSVWAKRCIKQWKKKNNGQKLFGIVQGGTDKELRLKSATELGALPFSGYAIGGLAVGESRDLMYQVLDYIGDHLPKDKPRYLMGVGKPEEIVTAVKSGVDMFDCVIPTREARHGRLYAFCNKKDQGAIHLFSNTYYRTINVLNSNMRESKVLINKKSKFQVLRESSFAYLNHLLKIEEGLGFRIATLNNLEFYISLMDFIRKEIKKGGI